jgi:hypothetical protein
VGENGITLNAQDVFLQLIQGQSRIEAKLDSNIKVMDRMDGRVSALEIEQNKLQGERRFVKFYMPFLTVAISLVGSGFITYIFKH